MRWKPACAWCCSAAISTTPCTPSMRSWGPSARLSSSNWPTCATASASCRSAPDSMCWIRTRPGGWIRSSTACT
nr:MAG TPA: hypothetical protein [Caudoviricetes sp.]